MANYGEMVEALRSLQGTDVTVTMRSSAGAADRVTVSGTLGAVDVLADFVLEVGVGEAAHLMLHFDEVSDFNHAYVRGGAVTIVYDSGATVDVKAAGTEDEEES